MCANEDREIMRILSNNSISSNDVRSSVAAAVIMSVAKQ